MAFENLSERERQVLAHLVEHYVTTAGPVGSRSIANRSGMGLSPATIRNTMQDLEELGLLEQPHTSAGRVPTDVGYRFYVDYLLKPERLTDDEKLAIKQTILKEGRGVKEILGQTVRVLSDITRQLGVSIAPRFESGILCDVRLVPIAEGRLMVIVVIESGLARTMILEVEADLDGREVLKVEEVLNERLRGLTLSEIRESISKRLAEVVGEGRLLRLVIDAKDKIWTEHSDDQLVTSGHEKLLLKPEFSGPDKLQALVKIIEDKSALASLLQHAHENDLVVTIGRENDLLKGMISCSLVTASYKVGNISGAVGIIGPTRMSYSKAVSIVEYTARSITDVLSGIDKDSEG